MEEHSTFFFPFLAQASGVKVQCRVMNISPQILVLYLTFEAICSLGLAVIALVAPPLAVIILLSVSLFGAKMSIVRQYFMWKSSSCFYTHPNVIFILQVLFWLDQLCTVPPSSGSKHN